MKKNKTAVTLVEMLIVIAVIMIMVATVIALAAHFDNQGKQRLVKGTFALLETALEQYSEFGYTFRDYGNYTGNNEAAFYRSLTFPPDCNGFDQSNEIDTLNDALDTSVTPPGVATHDPNYSSTEVMYFFLSQVPACRTTLDKIDRSLLTSKGANNQDRIINFNNREYPLWRVIDPWGTSLRYDYYINENEEADWTGPAVNWNNWDNRQKSKRPFPVLTSAGPDKEFGTEDDISSR